MGQDEIPSDYFTAAFRSNQQQDAWSRSHRKFQRSELFYDAGLQRESGSRQAEFERQQRKIFNAMGEINAAIFGLQELENNPSTLSTFVSNSNSFLEESRFAGITTGVVGSDAITCGIIYQPDLVVPVSEPAILEHVDPVDKSSPSIAQTFRLLGFAELFTAVVQHLKSKGSQCEEDEGAQENRASREGNCGYTRYKHAFQLANWLGTNPTNEAGTKARFILLGDFNPNVFDRSIIALRALGYVSLAERDLENPFSLVFSRAHSTLDNFMASL